MSEVVMMFPDLLLSAYVVVVIGVGSPVVVSIDNVVVVVAKLSVFNELIFTLLPSMFPLSLFNNLFMFKKIVPLLLIIPVVLSGLPVSIVLLLSRLSAFIVKLF